MTGRTPIGRRGAALGLLLPLFAAAPAGADTELDCVMQPKSLVTVSAPIEGLVSTVLPQRGDTVKKGEVLATLESSVEQVSVDVARVRSEALGPVRSAEARLQFAQSTLSRQAALGEQKIVAEAERDKAQSSKLVAEAELLEAREQRRTAELEFQRAKASLDLRTIRSPVDGIVVERLRSPGEYADPPQIIKIAEVDPLTVEVFAPLALYGQLEPGTPAEVMPEAPVGGRYKASVTSLDRVLDAASGTFVVRLELANPGYRIPAGLNCRIRFAATGSPTAAPPASPVSAAPAKP